jgi:WD40 repeat protein
VYREEFTLAAGGHGVSIFEPPAPGSHYGLLTVACDDATVVVNLMTRTGKGEPREPADGMVVRSPAAPFQTVMLNDLGAPSRRRQPLWPTSEYHLVIARGHQVLHAEVVRMKAGEERTLSIPAVVLPERTVELKPKSGSFPPDAVRMEIAPDRSAVAVGRFDGPILVFDAATGRARFTVSRKKSDCTAFGFSPDGKRLAYLIREDESDTVLRVVDAGDGRPVGKDLKPQPGRSFSNSDALTFSAGGNRLAVSAAHNADPDNHWESRILRWELTSGAEPLELEPLQWQTGTIEQLRFTPNGSEVLAVAGTHTWTLWAWDTGQPGRRGAAEVDFAYDRAAVGGPVEAVAGWGQLTKRPGVLFSQRRPSGLVFMAGVDAGPIRFGSLAVSPDGGVAAAGVKGGANAGWEQLPAVRVWDTGTQKLRAVLLGHTDWPLDVAFDRAGTGLMTAGKDGTVRTWRLP